MDGLMSLRGCMFFLRDIGYFVDGSKIGGGMI